METFVAIDFSYSLTLTFSFKFNKYFFKDLCFLGMFTVLLTALSMRYLLQIAGNQKNEHQIFIQNSKKRSHGLFHLKKYIQSLCHYSRQTGGNVFSSTKMFFPYIVYSTPKMCPTSFFIVPAKKGGINYIEKKVWAEEKMRRKF